ncbi:tripartite tricarboxylate transporter TctB family protein [Denitrobaculum tricleocarpae]|uniref:Tripartite tricarboxylate transporter TctB family protein n=1 Tax=Denitrobaculum tricleocarpae TaxID=2591009 RepID=A0A545TMB5_9PROT|nr:tripartite tricarboxylate transporter TctB family protein [Denitrobaculum tricleocarpae]TQV78326.1 tripartite tricarboxylate transporter TctB family protein [Denitrobaculum tricleocarpae]
MPQRSHEDSAQQGLTQGDLPQRDLSQHDLPGRDWHRFERWFIPCLIIAFCMVAFWLTTTFKTMPPILKRGIQPSDFPQLLLGLLVLLTLFMVWKDPIRVKERMHRSTWGTILLFAVFAATTAIDLFLALAIFAVAMAAYWGERRVPMLGLVGLVVPVAIFFIFDQVFEIRFPRGLLTNLWYG